MSKSQKEQDDPIGSVDYAHECLRLIARLLLSTGHRRDALLRTFSDTLRSLREAPRHIAQPDPDIVADLPHVLSVWHGTPRYLIRGRPKPLPLHSRGPCLAEIIAAVFPTRDPHVILAALMRCRQGLRRKGNLYQPIARNLVLDAASARVHALVALLGYLSTLESNVTGGSPCIQRTAINSRYAIESLASLRKLTQRVTRETLEPVDDFMERHEVSAGDARPYARVGFGTFAFVQPGPRPKSRSRPRRRKMPNSRGVVP